MRYKSHRHTTSVARRDGTATGSTWIVGGKRQEETASSSNTALALRNRTPWVQVMRTYRLRLDTFRLKNTLL